MKMSHRRAVGLVVLATAVGSIVATINRDEPDTVAAVGAQSSVREDRANAAPPDRADALDVTRPARRGIAERPADAFQARSWAPPPPAVQPVKPVARVAGAPPLPFTYLGRFQDKGESVIFLVRGDRILTVSAGEIIEGTYKVEGIDGSTLGLTYLPLNIRQTLDVGAAG